jgi:hypothetical protein
MSVLFSKALNGQCRWFVSEGAGNPRVCGAAISWPTSYCLGHRLRVYQRTEKTPAPPQEFAVLRRAPEPETLLELTEVFG